MVQDLPQTSRPLPCFWSCLSPWKSTAVGGVSEITCYSSVYPPAAELEWQYGFLLWPLGSTCSHLFLTNRQSRCLFVLLPALSHFFINVKLDLFVCILLLLLGNLCIFISVRLGVLIHVSLCFVSLFSDRPTMAVLLTFPFHSLSRFTISHNIY